MLKFSREAMKGLLHAGDKSFHNLIGQQLKMKPEIFLFAIHLHIQSY
jgi:hypothetical protein